MNNVYFGDNLSVLALLPDSSFQLIYIDPPFNTGKKQTLNRVKMQRVSNGGREGFGGNNYEQTKLSNMSYDDDFDDFLGFIRPRLEQAKRLLKDTGTLYLHIDYREVHYVKVLLDEIFGRDCFLNEIIWAYDYGAKAKNKWPTKHDNILVYVKNPTKYYFSNESVDRESYMAPGLVSKEKAEKGKLPTDTWWHTIVPTNGKERTGYPTQKPEGILRRIISASSRPNDMVLDFFAGSGTTGAVANQLGRNFVLIDNNLEAISVMKKRFASIQVKFLKLK